MKNLFNIKWVLPLLISISLPFIIWYLSKDVKELSFKNIAITELVSEKDIEDESIKVFFDERRVYNLYSISCIISNSGNIPIEESDYTEGLVIQFSDSLRILKYSLILNPASIKNVFEINNRSSFLIVPDLLNPNESIEFSFYVSSPSKNLLPSVHSRIIGGEVVNLKLNEEIKPKTEFGNRVFRYFEGLIFWFAFVYTILYVILIFWAVFFQGTGIESKIGKLFFFLALSVGLFMNLFYLIQTWWG